MLRRLTPAEIPPRNAGAVDAQTLADAALITDDVRARGFDAVRDHALRLGDIDAAAPLVLGPEALRATLDQLPAGQAELLERTAARIRRFASAQREALSPVCVDLPGGRAGHSISPVERAGCYAPGGRFPLPSSVLMTALTARVAGVSTVWVASPRPTPVTLAAAAVAGADAVLCVGGAQAIAAFAYGAGPVPACDVIVGPGNRWVTAAKQIVSGRVAIDMLAGPSELVVLADASADAATVAADLIAQAEHDPDALPILVTADAATADAVDAELARQLVTLPTAPVARQAIARGFCVLVSDLEEGIHLCNVLGPEHLEVLVGDAEQVAARLTNYGGLFVGAGTAEVLGDYGAGPNHVLPTGGTSRYTGGLSVFDFLRVRTWMRIDDPAAAEALVDDAIALARLEGLEGHARSAQRRKP